MSTEESPRIAAAKHFAGQQKPQPGVLPALTPEKRYRKEWVRRIIARGEQAGRIPAFGSAEWAQLDDQDPRKAASAVGAAEAWAAEGDDLAFRLLQEDFDRRKADDAFWEQQYAKRKGMAARALDEMEANRRRAQPREVGTYQGGALDFWTGRPISGPYTENDTAEGAA